MILNVELSRGYTSSRIKAELYHLGVSRSDAFVVEGSSREVVSIFDNYYDILMSQGIFASQIDIKGRGLEKELFDSLKSKLTQKFGEISSQVK